jgi:hypothetical protein
MPVLGSALAQIQPATLGCFLQEMERHETDLRGLRGMFVVGSLMAFMGMMNAFNTCVTIVAKNKAARRSKARIHASKST